MLINVLPPSLPSIAGFQDTAALCQGEKNMNGLRGDPFGITDVLGLVSNWITAGKQEKIAKEQINVQQAALKQQKLVDAENLAVQQANALTAASEKDKQTQVIALFGVVGVAVIVTGLFLYGAVKK